MPRYYLNIRDGDDLIEDPDGSVLPDVAAARQEALLSAREMLANLIRQGKVLDGQCVEIRDQDGLMQGVVWFRDVIKFA